MKEMKDFGTFNSSDSKRVNALANNLIVLHVILLFNICHIMISNKVHQYEKRHS